MKDQSQNRELRVVVILIVTIFVLWGVSGLLIYQLGETGRGSFGDMFGAINALFSGLAFAGVIYAILLQRRELELQRKELELTRLELTGSREAQEKQARTLAASAELSVLNTLIQQTIRKEDEMKKHAEHGAYEIDETDISTLMDDASKEREVYIARMKALVENLQALEPKKDS